MPNEKKVMSLWYSVLPDVKWCGKSEVENGTVARLLGNCFWGWNASSAVLLGALVSEAEQGALRGRYRKRWHTGLRVPGVLFQSYICCAKGSCQGTEVVMEFSSWGDSKKLQCMWNIIKEIKPGASVVILCGCQPSGDCSLWAESRLRYCEGASVGPFLRSALKLCWARGEERSKFCCKTELGGEKNCGETFLMMVLILTTFITIFSEGIIIINVFIVPLWVGAAMLSFFRIHRIETQPKYFTPAHVGRLLKTCSDLLGSLAGFWPILLALGPCSRCLR